MISSLKRTKQRRKLVYTSWLWKAFWICTNIHVHCIYVTSTYKVCILWGSKMGGFGGRSLQIWLLSSQLTNLIKESQLHIIGMLSSLRQYIFSWALRLFALWIPAGVQATLWRLSAVSRLGTLGGVGAKHRLLARRRTNGIYHLDRGGVRKELSKFSQQVILVLKQTWDLKWERHTATSA